MKETLQISDVGDAAVYLLNPQVINHDGEWEAWFFADWLPGVHRYRSFQEMMEAQFAQFALTEWQQPEGVQGELPDEYIGAPGNPKRRLKKRKKHQEKRILGKRISQWSADELLAMLDRDDYDIIHGEVMQGLGLLKDRRAIEPLLEKVREGDPSAMYAVKAIDFELLREPLLDILRRRYAFGFHAAAELLAELKAAEAIPLIVQTVLAVGPKQALLSDCTAQHLGAFGTAGADALEELLRNPDTRVRRRAVSGIFGVTGIRAAEMLRPLLSDPDPGLRE